MNQTDADQLAKEIAQLCQLKIMSAASSPIKQAVLIAVMAAILIPEMPSPPSSWNRPPTGGG